MAYCLVNLKEQPGRCEYVDECKIKIYDGEYNGEDLYIKGLRDSSLELDRLCKRDEQLQIKIMQQVYSELEKDGYSYSEFTWDLMLEKLRDRESWAIK